jgi:hypothetical protein
MKATNSNIALAHSCFTRRAFLTSSAATAALAGTAGLSAGCNVQQWFDIALADLPTVLTIIGQILQMVGAASPINLAELQSFGKQVTDDLNLAKTLIAQYKAAATSGLLNEIDAALNDAETNLNAILSALHVKNPTLQTAISAAIGSAIIIVLSIEALLPKPATAAPAVHANATVAAGTLMHEQIHGSKNGTPVMLVAFNLITKDLVQYQIR